ncbi:MAG: response regulator [Spirochaetia bacterium]|jgi:PAS domain S-box-containing protein
MTDAATILLVEDSPTQAEQIRGILEQGGYKVRMESNGLDALTALKREPAQVVLSDIIMPGMDGYTLCRNIKDNESTWDTPVILLTSLSDPEDVIKGLASGADNFIIKPFEPAYLLSRIQNILTSHALSSGDDARMGLEIFFGGRKHYINSDRLQILNLLISTYDNAVHVNQKLAASQAYLEKMNNELESMVRERTKALSAEVEEHHQTMAALRNSEEYYRVLLENDLSGVVVTAPDGKITDCNQAFLRIFRFSSRDEAREHLISELYWDPADRLKFLDFLAKNEKGEYHEQTFRRVDGEQIIALENGIGKRSETGELVQIIRYILDITDRKKLETNFLHAQKMEAIGRLAGGIAHDFNNMLMVILGFTDILAIKNAADDGQRRYLGEIRKATMRAAGLTQQLLAFSRKQVLKLETFSLNDVIEETAKMISRLIGEDVALHLELQESARNINADRGQISQVLMNLAVNSRDAMPKGGRLEIETNNQALTEEDMCVHPYVRPGQYVRLHVRDTGEGMDKQVQAHIFEPFFTTKERGKGTGLGLATVYGIVKQSGGYIWCDSEPGKGCTFVIHFPASEADRSAQEFINGESELLTGTETILLAEDEQMVGDILDESLAQAGYTVVRAANGREALELCRSRGKSVDLVLSDVVMPDMRGPEMARLIRETLPDVKFILMSGYPDLGDVSQILPGPDDVFLQKPVSAQALLGTVRKVLDRRTQTKPENNKEARQ